MSKLRNASSSDSDHGAEGNNDSAATLAKVLQFKPRDPKRPLNYRMAVTGDAAEISLYDSIGADGWGISAKQFADDLKGLGKVKAINLRVNCDGGDVFQGRAIYTNLVQHPARVVAHVDGVAASIASLICMAADEIRMADGAFMMIHNAWTVSIGNAQEFRRMADLLESVDASIEDTYAARTKTPVTNIRKMMAAETWMTAREAVDSGFADVMDEPKRIAAAITDASAARFRNLPKALLPRRQMALQALAALRAKAG